MKILLWAVGLFVLALIVGIGSCTYLVGRRVHRGIQEAKRAIEESKSGQGVLADRDVCALITIEELNEIYKRSFAVGVRSENSCRYEPGVNIAVEPDFFKFVQAVRDHHAQPQRIHGARGFFASGELYLSYHGLFIRIHPAEGHTDAEEIAEKVLPRL